MKELPSVLRNILVKTGCYDMTISDKSLEWMLSIRELYPFYNWIIYAITEDNFVFDEELLSYNRLLKCNQLIEANKLNSKLSSCIESVPIINLQETSLEGIISAKETKLKVLKNLKNLKCRIRSEIEIKNKEHDHFIDQMLQNKIGRINNLQKKFNDQFQSLEQKFVRLSEKLSALDVQNENEPAYFCQYDLSPFELQNLNLELYIDVLKTKIFEESKDSENLDSTLFFSDEDTEMNKLYRWMVNEEFNARVWEIRTFAATNVLEYLMLWEKNFDNVNFLFGDNSFRLKNEMKKPDKDELLISCEIYMKDIIRGIQLSVCEGRLKKRQRKLELLEELENVLKIRKLCNDSLHYLLKNEWKTIRASVSLLEDIDNYWESYISGFKKRMASMKCLILQQEVVKYASNDTTVSVYDGVSTTESGLLRITNRSGFMKCDASFAQLADFDDTLNNYFTKIRTIKSHVNEVDRSMFNSPTRTVRFSGNICSLLQGIYSLLNSMPPDKIKELHYKFKNVFEKQYDLFHLMYYEWMKCPSDVVESILKMEERVLLIRRRISMVSGREIGLIEFSGDSSQF